MVNCLYTSPANTENFHNDWDPNSEFITFFQEKKAGCISQIPYTKLTGFPGAVRVKGTAHVATASVSDLGLLSF